jgi:LmbE family N-acetylglucosaminyl deacetylase
MLDLATIRRIAVVAPHPDDEILGCGGTMARAARAGAEVHVVVVTRGRPPQFDEDLVKQIREETLRAHASIGVAQTHFLDFPAAELDRIGVSTVNAALGAVLLEIEPELLLIPFIGDIHLDHQIVFNASLVHARPRDSRAPRAVLAYETLSETNWLAPGITPGFLPNTYIDITETLDAKIAAFEHFSSQIKPSPDERSILTIRALAVVRGSTVFRSAAEGFMMIRQIL